MAKASKKGSNFVSKEISQLMHRGPSKGPQKGKKMPQKQAIAVALSVARRKGLKVGKKESLERTPLRTLSEVSPPGWAGTIRAMKTHGHTGKGDGKIDNPYALAWWEKKRGEEPHYRDQKTSLKGEPKKKPKFKDEDEKEESMSIFDDIIGESRLTTTGRKRIKKGNFALPGKKGSKAGKGSYPIHDRAHARNALARVSRFGTASEKARVRAAVHKKYPGIGDDDKKDEAVSIFDALLERELPEAFKKNMSRFKLGGKKEPEEGESAEHEASESPEEEREESDCNESMFDALVQESSTSVFDGLLQESSTAEANWEDRMARAMTLADELVSIRGSYKK